MKNTNCHSERSRGIFFNHSFLRSLHATSLWLALVGMTLLLSFSSLAAEDKKEEKPAATVEAPQEKPAGLFAPDFCDFEMTFPEAPLTSERCLPSGQCYTLQTYTMVYDLHTTVDISVNCTPSTTESFGQYSKGVMKAALAGMIEERNLDTYDINYSEDEKTKSASLTGTGKTGAQDKIYTAQMWIGQNSVFTVQAELIGGAHDVADKSFGDILKSLKTKEGKQVVIEKKVPIPKQGKNQ